MKSITLKPEVTLREMVTALEEAGCVGIKRIMQREGLFLIEFDTQEEPEEKVVA